MTSPKRTPKRPGAGPPARARTDARDGAGAGAAAPARPVPAPDYSQELAQLAALLADRTRAAFCLALLDGRAWTAGELAAYARVAPSTTSEHLSRLIDGGLLVERRQGRHRYVQLAGPRVAELLESVTAHLDPPAAAPRGLRAVNASAALARGRTCYDHLAGRLGVALTDAMTTRGLLDQDGGFALTDTGREWFADALGIPSDTLRGGRRPPARGCLDWTERRQHLAGTAGARLCDGLLERHWIRRIGTGRAVRLTPEGTTALRELLGFDEQAAGLV
ncbi:ArsR/SmtB family transcription factor [Streptomyces sp. NPDC058000]|uniref:ArsR/SmtB family transcription factor n=1 Tax=Streptomyces sp. NPDC058000 TaxID=3346299 RepID=UPI0036E8A0EE